MAKQALSVNEALKLVDEYPRKEIRAALVSYLRAHIANIEDPQ